MVLYYTAGYKNSRQGVGWSRVKTQEGATLSYDIHEKSMWVGNLSLHTSLKHVYTFYCYVEVYVLLQGENHADKFQIHFKLRVSAAFD